MQRPNFAKDLVRTGLQDFQDLQDNPVNLANLEILSNSRSTDFGTFPAPSANTIDRMKSDLNDTELLRSMLAGDEEALALLYRRRQGAVYRFALQMSGSKSDC